jgi:CheY-like chemotaxis protein
VTIAFLTSDLVFPSRVAGIAARLGTQQITAATVESLTAKLESISGPVVALLDLNSPTIDPSAVVAGLKSLPNPPRSIVAFGPHVHEAKLAAATAAGCDLVLTRGQFSSQIDELLSSLLKPT